MDAVRIAVAQLALSDGDYEANFEKIARTVANYGPSHDLIVLPETATSGFASRDDIRRLAEPLDGPTVTSLKRWSRQHSVSIVCGLAERCGSTFYNTAVIVSNGRLDLVYRKTHLWTCEYGMFSPGNSYHATPWCGTQLGALICFDIEFPEPARAIAALGSSVLVVCDGNMTPYGPPQRALTIARALENQIFVAIANRVGEGRQDTFAGGSLIINPEGHILAEADDRSEMVLSAELDLSQVDQSRSHYDYLKLRRIQLKTKVSASSTKCTILSDTKETLR